MAWLRSGVFTLYLWLTVIAYGTVMLTGARLASRAWLLSVAQRWSRAVLRGLEVLCNLEFRVYGLEHLPPGPAVVLSKHQSAWETIALGMLLPLPQTWVMKRELLRIPVFGWALALFDPIAIDRKQGRHAVKALLQRGCARLRDGDWIVIFPEGTRVPLNETKRFAIGGAALAAKAGVPVVPIAHNAGVFWPRRSLLKHSGCIDVVIGPPIPGAELSASAISARAEDWINETVESLPGTPRTEPRPRRARRRIGIARR